MKRTGVAIQGIVFEPNYHGCGDNGGMLLIQVTSLTEGLVQVTSLTKILMQRTSLHLKHIEEVQDVQGV